MRAASDAFPRWRATPPHERIRLLRRVAQLIEERVYHIAAAVTLEVGKNRMEALGEVQETADFFNVYCDSFEQQGGFDHVLPNDPLPNVVSRNRSVMKPYGVWVVINPFNFPFALAGGPVAAALVTGNTVVLKGASETPWAGRLLADCLRDAGLPPGVFNYLMGPGAAIGDALVDASADQRRHVHRLLRNGHGHPAQARRRPLSETLHRRDGRQECLRRHRERRSRTRFRRHRAQRVRHGRTEMLGVVAPVCRRVGRGRAGSEARAAHAGDRRGRSDAQGKLAGSGGQRDARSRKYGGYVDGLRQGGAKLLFGGEVLSTGRSRARLLRPADARRGGARASACGAKKCSCRS